MPHIPPLRPEEAPDEVRLVYEEFHRRMAFPSPPNFIMTQGHSPCVARGTWDAVRNILVCGEIPRWTKEMIFVAISQDRGCRYCTAAHVACCRMLGVHPEILAQLVADIDKLEDTRVRQMIRFALKCARDPRTVTAEDHDALRLRGLTRSQVVELIGMAAFAVYANIVADATAMEPDPMFDQV